MSSDSTNKCSFPCETVQDVTGLCYPMHIPQNQNRGIYADVFIDWILHKWTGSYTHPFLLSLFCSFQIAFLLFTVSPYKEDDGSQANFFSPKTRET